MSSSWDRMRRRNRLVATVLENQPDDLSAAVADVWCGLADTMPAARLLLDVHAEHPAQAKGIHRLEFR